MTKIFNNINKVRFTDEAAKQLDGWEQSAPYDDLRIARITDTEGAGIAISKMGTSIPTPLARIFLFDTAFGQINSFGAAPDSIYGRLVSECLDMLEFIYNYGQDIKVKEWNVAQEIANLKASPHKGHQQLAQSLNQFVRDLSVKNIYLFYYQDVLIGGTSPYTLVYTSPNWLRKKPITDARGLIGNPLFDDYSQLRVKTYPLNERHEDFQQYLTRYIAAFSPIQRFTQTAFWQYVYRMRKASYTSIMGATPYTVADFRKDYSIVSSGVDIDLLGQGGTNALLLGYQMNSVPGGESLPTDMHPAHDYEIVSTKHPDTDKDPCVLNDLGITTANYTGNRPWVHGTTVPRNPEQPLSDRVLPGPGHVQYPYLTDADFLEDKLLRVSFDIDDSGFHTYGAPSKILLPLKTRFFEYFNVDDINQPGNNPSFAMVDLGTSVEVKLSIPVKCAAQPFIELKKTYSPTDIITVMPPFSLAVFPSYKLSGTNVPNIYSVLFSGSAIQQKLKHTFLSIDDTAINPVDAINTDSVQRTGDSLFVTVRHTFDLIRVEWDGARALVIPAFKHVTPSNGSLSAGIDFGTTNSYVCLSQNGGIPVTLEISKEDRQVLTLNKVDLSQGNYGKQYTDSMSALPVMNRALDREFAPMLLGTQSDVAFPYRTVVCESDAFAGKNAFSLFGHINVGFNFLKETFDLQGVNYHTSIKWDLQDTNPAGLVTKENRVKAFCLQVAWMLKNKVMLSKNPTSRLKVYLTFPYTMGRIAGRIQNYWRAAFDELMGPGNVTLERTTESIAPFFYLIGVANENFTKNALNVDIGGGTTDMLFADVENKRFYYNSSLFAANDIWGDGLRKVTTNKMDNGFVTYFEQLLNAGQLNLDNPSRKEAYNKYKSIVSSSADLMSYVFRYENEFHYQSYIENSTDKLMPVLFIHFAALTYHIAQVLKEKKMTVPTTVSFSGMGSQYIKLISNDERLIGQLFKGMLSEFMGFGFDDSQGQMPRPFNVVFQESPKEVTAQGAMLTGHPDLGDFAEFDEEELYVYGVPSVPAHITYGNAEKYKKDSLDGFEEFLKKFFECHDIKSFIKRKFDVKFSEDLVNALRNAADQSFSLMATKGHDADEDVEETLFFWPLKNGLYEASKL